MVLLPSQGKGGLGSGWGGVLRELHVTLEPGEESAQQEHCNDFEPLTCTFSDAFCLSILGYGY